MFLSLSMFFLFMVVGQPPSFIVLFGGEDDQLGSSNLFVHMFALCVCHLSCCWGLFLRW